MRLLWENQFWSRNSEFFVLDKQTRSIRPFLPPHNHDYSEVFLVQQGWCDYQSNEKNKRLGKNNLIIVRPDIDTHSITSPSNDFRVIQLHFHRKSYFFLKERYFEQGAGFLWDSVEVDFCPFRPVDPLWFESNFNRLLASGGALFDLEVFLLKLLDNIKTTNTLTVEKEIPDWLEFALKEIIKPEHFKNGVQGFIDLCGKSKEHVERTIKKKTGQTVSQMVNRSRMFWASYMLTSTDYDILDIALDCGFAGLSHFYKVFKVCFSESPSRYRKTKRNLIDIDKKDIIRYSYNPFMLVKD